MKIFPAFGMLEDDRGLERDDLPRTHEERLKSVRSKYERKVKTGLELEDIALADEKRMDSVAECVAQAMKKLSKKYNPGDVNGTAYLRKLSPQHLQIIVMRASGYRHKEIAAVLGITPISSASVFVNEEVKEIMREVTLTIAEQLGKVKERIEQAAGEALDVVLDVMRDPDETGKVRAATAFKLLEMAGHGAIKKVESTHTLNLDKEASDRITRALQLSGKVDVAEYAEFVEVASERGEIGSLQGGSIPTDSGEPPVGVPLTSQPVP